MPKMKSEKHYVPTHTEAVGNSVSTRDVITYFQDGSHFVQKSAATGHMTFVHYHFLQAVSLNIRHQSVRKQDMVKI